MTAASNARFDSPFNVVAGFRSRLQAEAAARRLMSAGLPGAAVEVEPEPDAGGPVETAELRAEMQDELNQSWGGPTGRQTRGALVGVAAFGIVGLAIGAALGLLFSLGVDASLAGMTLLGAILGAIGGSVAGLVTGGGFAPRLAPHDPAEFDDPKPLAERDVLLAVHVGDPGTAEQAARLLREQLHADRVDLVDASGTPLPPQALHPRPADPEGYWWNEAGKG